MPSPSRRLYRRSCRVLVFGFLDGEDLLESVHQPSFSSTVMRRVSEEEEGFSRCGRSLLAAVFEQKETQSAKFESRSIIIYYTFISGTIHSYSTIYTFLLIVPPRLE